MEQGVQGSVGEADVTGWRSADDPPEGKPGLWSRRVVVVTNAGNAFACSYFHGEHFGCWQNPRAFEAGEKIVKWTEVPSEED